MISIEQCRKSSYPVPARSISLQQCTQARGRGQACLELQQLSVLRGLSFLQALQPALQCPLMHPPSQCFAFTYMATHARAIHEQPEPLALPHVEAL